MDECKDESGNLLSYEKLEFTPYKNSQYWITEENPSRVRDVTVFLETNDGRYLAQPMSDWR